MSLQDVLPFVFDFLPQKRIEVEVSSARLSGDAGLLPVRQFDEAIQLTARCAGRSAFRGGCQAHPVVDGPAADLRHPRRV